MNIVWIIILIAYYIAAILGAALYSRHLDREFKDKVRKMTDDINGIIKYTENKQKEINRIKKKSAKLNTTTE